MFNYWNSIRLRDTPALLIPVPSCSCAQALHTLWEVISSRCLAEVLQQRLRVLQVASPPAPHLDSAPSAQFPLHIPPHCRQQHPPSTRPSAHTEQHSAHRALRYPNPTLHFCAWLSNFSLPPAENLHPFTLDTDVMDDLHLRAGCCSPSQTRKVHLNRGNLHPQFR